MKTIFLFSLITTAISCNQKATNGKTLVVDVRSKEIWKQGHACNGVNIPLPELEKHKAEILNYDTVIFVCETGQSAQQATSYMNAQKENEKHIETVFKNGISWTNYQTCP
ncbi:rhodanese-like domain-containing protein [Fluviicola sp.]|uniref:rhodanese-like domain-containing protein n=1 Tax=Fluviicola sp. TaxID=1917219 RepID=UPI0031DA4CF8